MKIVCGSFVALALICLPASAQQSSGDFMISMEDTSCRFDRSNPVIFPDGNRRFLVVWQDTRNGAASYYARLLDSTAAPVGGEFPIFSNSDVAFMPGNSFLVLGGTVTERGWPFDDATYYLDAAICGTDGNWAQPVSLGQVYLPWCGTGWLGYSHDLTPLPDGYICSLNASGDLTLSRRTWTGTADWTWELSYATAMDDSTLPVGISTCRNSNGDFASIYFAAKPDVFSFGGVAGTFFDGGDSLLARNIMIMNRDSLSCGDFYLPSRLKILPVSDTLYEVFVLSYETGELDYWKIDRGGKQVGNIERIATGPNSPSPPGSSTWIRDFAFAPGVDGGFSFIVSFVRSQPAGDSLHMSLLNFDGDGGLRGTPAVYQTTDLSMTLGKQFGIMKDSSYIIPIVSGGSILLNDYRDFALQWSRPVSDPTPGSNDLLTSILPADSGTFFISWDTQKAPRGRTVSAAGSPSEVRWNLPEGNLDFLPDGRTVGLRGVKPDDSSMTYVCTIYDKNFNAARTDTVGGGVYPSYYSPALKVMNGHIFILYSDEQKLKLRRFDMNLQYAEVGIPVTSSPYGLEFTEENDTSFWIRYNGRMRSVTQSLNVAGEEFKPPGEAVYLGDSRLLIPSQQFQLINNWGTILSLNGDTLAPTFPVSEYADAMNYFRLTDLYFLLLKRVGNDIYIRTFDMTGTPRIDPLLVSDVDNVPRKNQLACRIGNKLLVAWSEARTPGKGYDVYGRLFDIDKLTAIQSNTPQVPHAFSLDQNYPNPFNPTTAINYRLSTVGSVSLVVYDVLGRKVKTLVNESQSPGEHTVVFDGSGLASGVYFYSLHAGSYFQQRKMMLIK